MSETRAESPKHQDADDSVEVSSREYDEKCDKKNSGGIAPTLTHTHTEHSARSIECFS